ncbi:MAG TPA: hypothetical protein VHU23_12415 [Rhizomicrobium sp.]|jgi:hypothetical protein|nr:hypothetical protein [Rhizomicrobium sp.]
METRRVSTEEMGALTAGLGTKSDKIRRLGQAGYSRQQIADFLGIRYQHVRNVLVDEERRTGVVRTTSPFPPKGISAPPTPTTDPHRAVRLDIGPDGEIRLPRHIMEAAGTGPDRHLLVRFDDDEIKLVTPEATTRKIRAWVRKHVPDGVSLADELIDERRREFEREERESKG